MEGSIVEEHRFLISEAAKLVAVEAHVLRYWEEELEIPVGRTELGHRYYTRENIETFQNVKRLKEEGLQLKAIRLVLKGAKRPGLQEEIPEGEALKAEAGQEKAAQGTTDDGPQGRAAEDDRRTGRGEDDPETSLTVIRDNAWKLQQFMNLVEDIVEKVVKDNNEEIQKRLEESMARETDYLLHMQEKREEEHFRRLDQVIREKQKKGSYVAASREKRSIWDRLRGR